VPHSTPVRATHCRALREQITLSVKLIIGNNKLVCAPQLYWCVKLCGLCACVYSAIQTLSCVCLHRLNEAGVGSELPQSETTETILQATMDRGTVCVCTARVTRTHRCRLVTKCTRCSVANKQWCAAYQQLR
jgi:hypothetical protein